MTFLNKMKIRQVMEVEHAKLAFPVQKMTLRKARHAFKKALRKKGEVALIAEFKRSSPSRGQINQSANFHLANGCMTLAMD